MEPLINMPILIASLYTILQRLTWQTVFTHGVLHLSLLICLLVVCLVEDWSQGHPLAGSRVLNRYIWLVFEVGVSVARGVLRLLALSRVYNKVHDLESWCDSFRPLLMGNLRPGDFWPGSIESVDGNKLYFTIHKEGARPVAFDIGPYSLINSIATLMAHLAERDDRIGHLEAELLKARARYAKMEGKRTVLRGRVGALSSSLKGRDDLILRRTQNIRTLLLATLLLWRHTRQLGLLLSRALRDLNSAQRRLSILAQQNEHSLVQNDTRAREMEALESRLACVRNTRDNLAAEVLQWSTACGKILAVRFQETNKYNMDHARYKQTMAGLVVYLRALWRYTLHLRQQSAERAQAYEDRIQALRSRPELSEALKCKQNYLLSQMLTRYGRTLAARRADMFTFLQYRIWYRRRFERILTCLLILWRFTRILGRQLAQSQVSALAGPVLCKPETRVLEDYRAQSDPSALLRAVMPVIDGPLFRSLRSGGSSGDLAFVSMQNLTAEQLLATRFAQMHTAYASVTVQRDEAWAALRKAEMTVEGLREDQRSAIVALASFYMSLPRRRVLRPVELTPRLAETASLSHGQLTTEELNMINARITEIISQYKDTDEFAGPRQGRHHQGDSDPTFERPLTLSSNVLHKRVPRTPQMDNCAPSSDGSPAVKLGSPRTHTPASWLSSTAWSPSPLFLSQASSVDEPSRQPSCSPEDAEECVQDLADRLQLLHFYEDNEEEMRSSNMTLQSPPAKTRVHSLARPLFSVPHFSSEYLDEPVPFTPRSSWYDSLQFVTACAVQTPGSHHDPFSTPVAQSPRDLRGSGVSWDRSNDPSIRHLSPGNIDTYPYVRTNV